MAEKQTTEQKLANAVLFVALGFLLIRALRGLWKLLKLLPIHSTFLAISLFVAIIGACYSWVIPALLASNGRHAHNEASWWSSGRGGSHPTKEDLEEGARREQEARRVDLHAEEDKSLGNKILLVSLAIFVFGAWLHYRGKDGFNRSGSASDKDSPDHIWKIEVISSKGNTGRMQSNAPLDKVGDIRLQMSQQEVVAAIESMGGHCEFSDFFSKKLQGATFGKENNFDWIKFNFDHEGVDPGLWRIEACYNTSYIANAIEGGIQSILEQHVNIFGKPTTRYELAVVHATRGGYFSQIRADKAYRVFENDQAIMILDTTHTEHGGLHTLTMDLMPQYKESPEGTFAFLDSDMTNLFLQYKHYYDHYDGSHKYDEIQNYLKRQDELIKERGGVYAIGKEVILKSLKSESKCLKRIDWCEKKQQEIAERERKQQEKKTSQKEKLI